MLMSDFVDCIASMNVNFSGYCNMMTKSYKRHDLRGEPFMSSHTFMKWFKAWASSQQVDFRRQCAVCGENQKFVPTCLEIKPDL